MTARRARHARPAIAAARAGRCLGLAVLFVLAGSKSLQTAIANGDTRTIAMHHLHTGEDISITFKRNGRYDEEALKKLNWFLRDWRSNEQIRMDPQLIDLLWEAQHEVASKAPLQIVGGYRSPETNAMLRRRSGGVARFSQHMLGRAVDFYIPDVPLEKLRVAGLQLQRGGVGFYPASGWPFVHLDVGSVRHWPRMSREELVKVFPDGRTVHLPADGRPLPGYALALADIEKRGAVPSQISLAAARETGALTAAKPNLFAALFGARKARDEEEETDVTAATPVGTPAAPAAPPPVAPPAAAAKPVKAEPPAAVAAAQLPRPRPARFSVAAAPAVPPTAPAVVASPVPAAVTKAPARMLGSLVPLTANDVIALRGYWQGLPENEPVPAPVRVAARTPDAVVAPAASRLEAAAGPALAYAAEPGPGRNAEPAATPMGRLPLQAAPVAAPALPRRAAPPPAGIAAVPATTKHGADSADHPWLRAVVLTPSVRHFLTATLLGAGDARNLRRFMEKPSAVARMTFSDDPLDGLAADRFSGGAVVFVETVMFASRTAALH